MSLPRKLYQGLRALGRRQKMEQDMEEELRHYLGAAISEKTQSGMTREEAARAAGIEMGSLEAVKDEIRAAGWEAGLEALVADVRYGVRVLRRNPGFTCVAVLSLALGIGANTVVFSVLNALVLRPLPVERPQQLIFVETNDSGLGHSFPTYRDLRDRNQTLAGLAGYRIAPMELESASGPTRIWGLLATGNYFDLLGIRPALGRFFHAAEDLLPRASPYVVLSDRAWRTRFGGDSTIVGKTIRINRLPYTVLGVAPASFRGTELWYWPDVWVPMMMEPQIENHAGSGWLENRNTWNTWVIGRLKPGTSSAQALANLNAIAAQLAREHPNNNEGLQFKLAKPGLAGDYIGGPTKAFTLGVLSLASMVLLAACANLASLLAARAADRQREIAIRLSIGAGRARVLRQVLTETLLLSFAGGTAGCVLSLVLCRALSRWQAPLDFPVRMDVNPDWRVFLFAVVISVLAGALFGCAPAWGASQTDASAVLKGALRNWGHRRLPFRDLLVVVQVALCFLLVAACLTSVRGLERVLKMRLGFEPEGVSLVSFDLGLAGYADEEGRMFQRRVLDTVKQLPGVRSAAYSNSVPLSLDQSTTTVFPGDKTPLEPAEGIQAQEYQISPGYFATMGTVLVAGEDFAWHDANGREVAIVNLSFAKRVLGTENAVGKQFRESSKGPLVEVIGMVEDGKYGSLTESPTPAVFWPILERYNSTTTLEVRSSLPASQMVDDLRRAVASLDRQLPLYGAGSLEQMLGFAFLPARAAAVALSAFGLLAIMLAITGVHGLVSYAVARRVREIGIRIAVGASPSQLLRLVVGRIAVLLAIGAMIGLLLALAADQVLASVVYQVSARDPQILAAVLAAVALLGLVSSWAPTHRALRIDPMVALRWE